MKAQTQEGEQRKAMSKSRSKLSPWPYIRNNRVRSTVLVISLAMFMVMIYMMNYIIGGTNEPFRACTVDPMTRLRFITPDVGVNDEEFESSEAYLKAAWERVDNVAELVKKEKGVKDAKTFSPQYINLNAFIGQMGFPSYLFRKAEDCQDFIDHMGAKLVSGRMPEKPGELLVEKKVINNHNGDNTMLQNFGRNYEVVGVVESPYYLSCGIAQPAENNVNLLAFVEPDSKVDLRPALEKAGYSIYYYEDEQIAEEDLVQSMGGTFDEVQTLFTAVSGTLLMICVSVVLAMHIKDRHNEWCLLNSIGFKTGEIYFLALKELLICVVTGFVLGSVLSYGGCFLMEKLLYNPIGISIRVLRPQALPRVMAVFAALVGIAQISLFNGMRKIQTIDSIE